ncbi:MAG: 50S ribosomal protein L25 [Acidimicrobiales bacterium]
MSTVVTAKTGRATGSGPARRLRAEGELPGVVYGLGQDPISVNVTYTELRDALKGEAGMNTVFMLDLEGTQTEVIVRDVQRDPIKRTVTHADFLRVDERSKITVTVPVVLTGKSSAVADAGGIIEQKLHQLKVRCSPHSIPNEVSVDISPMTLDDRLAVGDVALPDGVVSKIPGRITIAATVIPRGARTDEEEEGGEEGETAAEADAEASED